MAASVSVPEKTLEHWVSQYVTYRFKSRAALWWPAAGEDVDVAWLPARPGKAVQLELKTTKLVGVHKQDVLVDLGQLWDYCRRPLGLQPFYVFPRPDWGGELATVARHNGVPVTELAFRRSGEGWWFADWMVVLTTAEVADILSTELRRHGSPKRGEKRCLVRYDTAGKTETWGSGGPRRPAAMSWLDFWDTLLRCGQADWPQLVRLPAQSLVTGRAWYPPEEALRLLRAAARQEQRQQDLVTLVPSDGGFLVAADEDHSLGDADWPAAADGGVEDHRQVVFLDAAALKGQA
ncbi:hypothetical protein ACWCOV_09900 [Kribbella sp. NPDC002412]